MSRIRCMLNEAAGISKHQPGIVQGDRIILYSEWDNLAQAVADRLRQRGVVAGERVAVFMANDWRLLAILLGIMRAGGIACPLSTRLPRAAVVDQMRQIDCRRIIAFLSGDKGGDLEGIEVIAPDALTAAPDQAAEGAVTMDLDAPALLLFTSGSSGAPRPAVLSYGNLYYNAHGANANMRLHSKDRWLLQLPMYHVSGIGVMFRCILGGAVIAIPESRESLSEAIRRYQPTHVSIVPTQLSDLLDHDPPEHADGIRAFLVGGAGCDPTLVERARDRKWPVYLTYGMTETGSQIATMPPDAPPAKRAATCGKPLRHRTVRIADHGEILVKGPCVFKGYWQRQEVVPALDDEGWFRTGDLGSIDREGYLVVRGRRDALIISGGENIQPEEIEGVIGRLAGVEAVLVVPVPHKRFGQRPVAFVKAAVWDDRAWRKQLNTQLPSYKVPDAFLPWPADAAPGFKPSRSHLAELAARTMAGAG